MSSADQLRCFVIGPIGDKDAEQGSEPRETYEQAIEVLEEVIGPACRAFGLDPLRADEIADPGEIPEQIFKHLRDDDVVIADLTGANANVMYELGLRHTTGKLTIQLGERERLPFDVSAIRTILFRRTAGGLVEARRKLSAVLSTGIEGRIDYVTATRVFLESHAILSSSAQIELSEEDSPGFLEKVADMEQGIEELAPAMNIFNKAMVSIHEILTEATDEMTATTSAGGKVRVANRTAARLSPVAQELEEAIGDFRAGIEKGDPGTRFLLNQIKDGGDVEGGESFRESVRSAAESIGGTVEGALTLSFQMRDTGEATRDLRKVNQRLSRSLQVYAELAQKVQEWGELA